jgi:hypothetical protein
LDSGFAEALVRSPTFLWSILEWLSIFLGAGLAGLAIVVLAMSRLRGRVSLAGRLRADDIGSVVAIDLVLVMVPVIVIMLVLIQSLWLMRETVIVHYAAYSAARSARVTLCPPLAESDRALLLQTSGKLGCNGDVSDAETAARLALVSASPPWDVPCQQNCTFPDRPLRAIAQETGTGNIYAALEAQARYAFDAPNVRLDVEFDPRYLALALRPGLTPPVRARLTYRHYVLYGLGPMFGVRRSDGYYYKETIAEVSVL